jgi:hypothetical protein
VNFKWELAANVGLRAVLITAAAMAFFWASPPLLDESRVCSRLGRAFRAALIPVLFGLITFALAACTRGPANALPCGHVHAGALMCATSPAGSCREVLVIRLDGPYSTRALVQFYNYTTPLEMECTRLW